MRPGPWFTLLLACCLVAVRMMLFEADILLGKGFPNHDMSQGLAFFATNVHNLRLTGDIVWWNPIEFGYAQYFQSFLSPLAPTPSHITFILWSYAVRFFVSVGVTGPSEYAQYLGFNYVLLPMLTYWALGELAREIVRRKASVALVVITYALSSTGLWNAAWFYFQESFTAFFLVGSFLRAVHRPKVGSIALVVLALLLQLSSANYWSVYNGIFFGLFLASYSALNPAAVRRLTAFAWGLLRGSRKAQTATVAILAVFLCWALLTLSIALEQAGAIGGNNIALFVEQRAKSVWTFTTELFNPGLEITLENYPAKNAFGGVEPPIHNARYLGVALLPLLVLLPFLRWRRRTAWLVPFALGLFVVCLAPHPLAVAVLRVPFLNQIQHLFYFYTAHFQLAVILFAACALDAALCARVLPRRPALRRVALGTVCVAVSGSVAVWAFGQQLPGFSQHSHYYYRAAGVGAAAATLVLGIIGANAARARTAGSLLFLALVVADLSAYFRHGSIADRTFTTEYWRVPFPIPAAHRDSLFRRMPNPDYRLGANAGLENALPIRNYFWPTNNYLTPKLVSEGIRHPDVVDRLDSQRALDFFPSKDPASSEMLILVRPPGEPPTSFPWRWLEWGYNDAAFQVETPQEGWLFFKRLYDPLWRYTVDGQVGAHRPSNYVGTAVYVGAGAHEIRLTYRPLARRLYGPASALLVVAVGFLLWLAVRRPRLA